MSGTRIADVLFGLQDVAPFVLGPADGAQIPVVEDVGGQTYATQGLDWALPGSGGTVGDLVVSYGPSDGSAGRTAVFQGPLASGELFVGSADATTFHQ